MSPVLLYFFTVHFVQASIFCVLGSDKKLFPDGKIRVGTHTLRKTAYLFAVFGVMARYEGTGRHPTNLHPNNLSIHFMEMDTMLKGARHLDFNSASTYFSNAYSKWFEHGIHEVEEWRFHKVSPWKPCYYESGAGDRINENLTTRTELNTQELAHWFVKEELGISVDEWCPVKATNLSVGIEKKAQCALTKFFSLLTRCLPVNVLQEAKSLFTECSLQLKTNNGKQISYNKSPPPTPKPASPLVAAEPVVASIGERVVGVGGSGVDVGGSDSDIPVVSTTPNVLSPDEFSAVLLTEEPEQKQDNNNQHKTSFVSPEKVVASVGASSVAGGDIVVGFSENTSVVGADHVFLDQEPKKKRQAQDKKTQARSKRQKLAVEGAEPRCLKEDMEKLNAYKATKPSRKDFYDRVLELSVSMPTTKLLAPHKKWVFGLKSTVKCVQECVDGCHAGIRADFYKIAKLFPHGGITKWTCKTCKERKNNLV
jgi:hypothetical protein